LPDLQSNGVEIGIAVGIGTLFVFRGRVRERVPLTL
jgi:hypothetical protein